MSSDTVNGGGSDYVTRMFRVLTVCVLALVAGPACASMDQPETSDVPVAAEAVTDPREPTDLDCVTHYWTLAMLLPPEDSGLAGERLRVAAIAHGVAHPGVSERALEAEIQPLAAERAQRIYERGEPLSALDDDLAACDDRYGFQHYPLAY